MAKIFWGLTLSTHVRPTQEKTHLQKWTVNPRLKGRGSPLMNTPLWGEGEKKQKKTTDLE